MIMSKDLPYFKFYPSQWISGDINYLTLELQGAFIQNAVFGDIDFGVSEPVEIVLTLRYDIAVLKF